MASARVVARIGNYARLVFKYAVETRRPVGFLRLMQVRLSLSKVGWLVCPRPVVRQIWTRSLGKVELRSHTSDISVLGELLVWGGYEQAVTEMPAPRTVLDLGANTGLAARWFMERWPRTHVVSVEPEPGNVQVLRHNLSGRDARVVPYAVGGSRRSAQLHTSNREFAYTINGPADGHGIPVEVVPLGDVLDAGDLQQIDLLKVDIEGAEAELFRDCGDWIGRVGWLVVECHGSYSVSSLLEDCRRGGATFEVIDLDEKPEWGFTVVSARRLVAPA